MINYKTIDGNMFSSMVNILLKENESMVPPPSGGIMKRLSNLAWTPAWTSVVGCIHGALNYLDIKPSLGWLFGGTGHGFIINMSQDGSCPSGPTAWKTSKFYELGRNLGFRIEGLFAEKHQPDWKDNQQKGWDIARTSLDQDLPVLGWELAVPEWYVVNGYDEVGYYYDGPGAERGPSPKPWDELGNSEIGLLEILSVKPTESSQDQILVKEALDFSIAFNNGSTEWVLSDYLAGQDAYQAWIDAVRSGKAILMGHAYNAAVWEECRRNAVIFLREAKKRLPGVVDNAFESAIRSYSEVAKQLKDVTELYPFFENTREEPLGENPKSQKAVKHLQAAKEAEKKGTEFLEEILEGIS
jgi:hypothetical protein